MSDFINIQDINCLSNKKLRKLVAEVEETLVELKAELEHRQEAKQDKAIANLENHMNSAETSLLSLKNFLAYIAESLRDDKK